MKRRRRCSVTGVRSEATPGTFLLALFRKKKVVNRNQMGIKSSSTPDESHWNWGRLIQNHRWLRASTGTLVIVSMRSASNNIVKIENVFFLLDGRFPWTLFPAFRLPSVMSSSVSVSHWPARFSICVSPPDVRDTHTHAHTHSYIEIALEVSLQALFIVFSWEINPEIVYNLLYFS